MSYRGSTVTLEQVNREVAIPFLTSSRGYGVLWDNPAHTEVAAGAGGADTIPAAQLLTADGQPGGLTAQYYQGQDLQTLKPRAPTRRWTSIGPPRPPPGLGQENFSVRWTGFVRRRRAATTRSSPPATMASGSGSTANRSLTTGTSTPAREDTATVTFAAHSRHQIRHGVLSEHPRRRHQTGLAAGRAAGDADLDLGGCRRDRLLLPLRPIAGRRDRRLSRPDGPGPHAGQMGAGLLAVQGAVPDAAGVAGHRPGLPLAPRAD